MTRKEEIQAEIAKLQKELHELNNLNHYILWSSGDFSSQRYVDAEHFAQGNIFETLEAAERERDRRALIKELRDRAGWYKPVWNGSSHFTIHWDVKIGWIWRSWWNYDVCPRSGYFEKPIDGLLEEFGDRLNLLRDV